MLLTNSSTDVGDGITDVGIGIVVGVGIGIGSMNAENRG